MPGAPLLVPVYYDFASTLSYVAHRVLGRIDRDLAGAGIVLEWRPIDLGLITGWRRGAPLDAPVRARVLGIARSLVGDLRMPTHWSDTRRAASIALGLAGSPAEATWRERVWTAVYEEGRDPSDPDEVRRWARDVGIAGTATPLPTDALVSATAAARQAGVTAVPTLLLAEWPMAGIQEETTMLSLLTRFAARRP